jgi:hypothetical protein
MRRQFLIFLILLTTDYCIGQGDFIKVKKIIVGINTCAFIAGDNYCINYFALLTTDIKKNRYSIGPIIGPLWKLNDDFIYTPQSKSRQIGINGFHLGSQIFPNSKGKTFDYFFQNQFILQYYRDKGVEFSFNEPYNSHLIIIGDYLGGGYQLKFLKTFYFTQSIGIGFIYKHIIIHYKNFPDNDQENHHISWTTNLGVGYKFK